MGERRLLAEGREAEVYAHGDGIVLKLWRDPGRSWRAGTEAAALDVLQPAGYPAPRPAELVTLWEPVPDEYPALVGLVSHGLARLG